MNAFTPHLPTVPTVGEDAARTFAAAIRALDALEADEGEPEGGMFKSDADRAADVSSYFNREG